VIELSEPEDGSSHTLPIGEELVVRLPENATTGCRWQFSHSGPGLLEQVEDTFGQFSGAEAGAPGAGGRRTVRFVGKQRGRVRVEARLGRSWESAAAAPKTVVYSIDIV
jgi:inhibitor of cysteine peptidase